MREPAPSLANAIVVISDLVEDHSRFADEGQAPRPPVGVHRDDCAVRGGYLERLALSAVRTGMVEFAEVWHHHRHGVIASEAESAFLTRRAFPISGPEAPFHSDALVEFVAEYGAPRILLVLGLGVSAAVLDACQGSIIIYNSIDVPALRVPREVSGRFDLVLTGAQWQSDEVAARHPGMATAILPVGPDFASPETFFPQAGVEKDFDVIYVAAAQGYKRHDVLFEALARSPQRLKALCVMGYGEDAGRLRDEAERLRIDVAFIGPPGVPYPEVNRLMNRARVGVVCGVDDGAPAILTEYMLAGLPVVANADLRCGLQYIVPETGIAAPADRFEHAIIECLSRTDFRPRETVLERWTWPHSIKRLEALIQSIRPAYQPSDMILRETA